MIDLHCHILPGLDDGPFRMVESVEMAMAACRDGTQVIVATPHNRDVVQRSSVIAAGFGVKAETGAEETLRAPHGAFWHGKPPGDGHD